MSSLDTVREKTFADRVRNQGYEPGFCCTASLALSEITTLALLVIGCMGVSGALLGLMPIGWTAVGAGAGLAIFSVWAGNLRERKLKVLTSCLMAATLITVGALGGVGLLSATQVSWALVGTILVSIPLRCGIYGYHTRKATTSSSLTSGSEEAVSSASEDEDSTSTCSGGGAASGRGRPPESGHRDILEELGQALQDTSGLSPAESGRQLRLFVQDFVRRCEEEERQEVQSASQELTEAEAESLAKLTAAEEELTQIKERLDVTIAQLDKTEAQVDDVLGSD